jgi:D-alanyl-lipoteichoic acid acyltransferase DltB (MBOAT superfamily)
MVFASWLAGTFVDEAFKYPDAQTFVTALAAIVGYSLQIFLDFAGYTLIVTGLALLLGFSLPINFKQPYLAINLQEFWRHWHISLSSFIRDYIYIPLGGNRKGFLHTQFNILLAMVISGLWHGANSTFIVWGTLHGLGVVFVNLYDKALGKDQAMPVAIARLFTLSYIALAWVFFRADNNEAAWQLLSGLVNGFGHPEFQHVLLAVFVMIFFFLSARAQRLEQACVQRLTELNWLSLTVLVSALTFIAILLGPSGVPGFIYYRF